MTEPSPCPDCDATQTVTPAMIARRDGTRAEIKLVDTFHADTCPTLRGIVR
jgi:hypothetical protein